MNKSRIRAGYVWLFAFCYASFLSLLFQKVALPMLPAMHAGLGLLKNDAFLYHQSAIALADNIHRLGWSSWSPWSGQTSTTGNVGVLSALYALFSPNPVLIIPVNAFFQAASAVLLLLIGRAIWPGRTGNLAGLIAASLFVMFPSSLSWYSQPMKDCYVITGMLSILYSWLFVFRALSSWHELLKAIAWMVAGVLLVTFVKPYYLKLLLAVLPLIALVVVARVLQRKEQNVLRLASFHLLTMVVVIGMLSAVKPYLSGYTSGENYYGIGVVNVGGEGGGKGAGWKWMPSSWVPLPLEKNVELAARTRVGMILFNEKVGAGSLIDKDSMPDSDEEVVEYLPRALEIGLFAPFPDTWGKKRSMANLLAAAETTCWYLLAPGLLIALFYRKSKELMVTVIFALCFLAIFSFVTPNVGTLYRYRFPYEFLLIVVAAGGWVQYLLSRFDKGKGDSDGVAHGLPERFDMPVQKEVRHTSKRKVVSAAMLVSFLTLVGYLGFFLRDLIMIRTFGAGNEMDVFYLGSMIPMFFVTILSMPVGSAMLPAYSEMRQAGDAGVEPRFVGSVLFFQASFMLALASCLFLFAPYIFSAIGWHYSVVKLAEISRILDIYLIIMVFGGLVIVANTVLNAEGRLLFPAFAQLVVPLVAIVVLVLLGPKYGIYAAVYGMLAGQLLNLALVTFALRGRNLIRGMLKPAWIAVRVHFPFRQYGILVAAAISTAMFVPLTNSIAATMSSGSVAIIGMGSKMIVLVTGVVGMGLTTVLLPYFSTLAARAHHLKAQSDLSFFLLFATVISVPAALALRLLAAPLAYRLMQGSAINDHDINEMIRTIQYGVAQLPFFVCSMIAIKYITAYQRAGVILLSSLAGLMLTLILSEVLIGHFGVSGIALAMTLAMASSSAIMVVYVSYLRHLPRRDSIFIITNWTVFAILFICFHFHLYAELLVLGAFYVGLSFGTWRTLIVEWSAPEPGEMAMHKVD